MIQYRCIRCNAELESPSCLAGLAERCPLCDSENTVPVCGDDSISRLQASGISDPTELLGNADAICPYCNHALEKKPSRKKKCPHCGQFIYVRTRPSDNQKVLVTEAQTEQIAQQWATVHGPQEIDAPADGRFEEEKAKLAKRFGRAPSNNDVQWSLLNQELVEHAAQQDWGLFRNTRSEMGKILLKESKFTEALGRFLEVSYLDLNGPRNCGGITDKELLREFPPWDPADPTAELAPAIVDWAASIICDGKLTLDTVEELYWTKATALYASLLLPLNPAKAWPKIMKELKEALSAREG